MDGFLRLTHGFCLEKSNSEQAGPPGTSVYTASQPRLGGPIFTPRCFPKKTSCRGPLPKVRHTENQTRCCCVICFSWTLIIISQNQAQGLLEQTVHYVYTGPKSFTYINCTHERCIIADILYLYVACFTVRQFVCSVCVFCLREGRNLYSAG